MSTYKLSRKGEDTASDIEFMEKCARDGLTPKGLRWNLSVQGMDETTEEKVLKIKRDAEACVIDVMIKGMKEKKIRTDAEREEAIEKELGRREGWEAIKWVDKVDKYQQKCREEAEKRKRKKLRSLQGIQETRKERENQERQERKNKERTDKEEEEAKEEERVVESWESLVDEEKVKEFGGKIYRKKESVECRMEELREVMSVFESYGLGVSRTPTDGNCFFHAVGGQLGIEHGEVRSAAVRFLRENQRMNGEEWSAFVDDGERGKRGYLRKMVKEGEWADHIMVLATASAFKRKIKIFAQGGLTEIEPREMEGADVPVGFIR